MRLSPEEIEAYRRDGFLSGIRIVEPDEAERIRREFDALEERVGRETAQAGLYDRHFEERFIWDIATHPAVLDVVRSILGPNVLLLGTNFFCKYPEDRTYVAWHQDVEAWGIDPPEALTVWYAVDDSDVESGCMRVIPGSHRRGIVGHGIASAGENLLSLSQEIELDPVVDARAVDLILKAGEISVHHGALIHGSLPNRSNRRRCGLTARYAPARVRQTRPNLRGETWRAVLVAGDDLFGHFEKREPPFPIRARR